MKENITKRINVDYIYNLGIDYSCQTPCDEASGNAIILTKDTAVFVASIHRVLIASRHSEDRLPYKFNSLKLFYLSIAMVKRKIKIHIFPRYKVSISTRA